MFVQLLQHVESSPDYFSGFSPDTVEVVIRESNDRFDEAVYPPPVAQEAVARLLPNLADGMSCEAANTWLSWTHALAKSDARVSTFLATHCGGCLNQDHIEYGLSYGQCSSRGWVPRYGECIHPDAQFFHHGCPKP